MRPQAIVHFEIVAIISLVMSQIFNFLTREKMTEISGVPSSLAAEIVIFVFTLGLILWISRLASNFARWLFIIFTILAYLLLAVVIPEILALGAIAAFSFPALTVLNIAAIYFLLSAEGRAWFGR